jgi:hypothetical protein
MRTLLSVFEDINTLLSTNLPKNFQETVSVLIFKRDNNYHNTDR